MNVQKINDLVRELKSEAWHEGFYEGIYNHSPMGHNVETRKQLLDRKALKEKITKEIEYELMLKVDDTLKP